ncbi:MAG: phosphoribosyl-ATP diphosphatase [Candidatus Aminicenantes bacterium]|nr:phosphoribosyl-ATP diphosphatase [Candidatus Aminicenantes bacterium]
MIIPSIDLMNGKAVQLKNGRDKVLEREDPAGLAREFDRFGEIAVIDLDAALGQGANSEMIRELCRSAECRVGGGLRSVEAAQKALAAGASKVIIGTAAFGPNGVRTNFLKELASAVGRSRIVIALDTRDGEILSRGWTEQTGLRAEGVLAACEPFCGEFLCTFVEKEGTMEGLPIERAVALAGKTRNAVTTAGGVGSPDEIARLSRAGLNVQLGMAVYTGRVGLNEAFLHSLDWSRNLVATIVQDETGQVLMLGWSDWESLERTIADGRMHFHSRSRDRLWLKGETSGNFLYLVRLRVDCDGDAVLATVRPRGPACHRETYSCFGPRRFSIGALETILADRIKNPQPGSYTSSLDEKMLAEKIREEAGELIAAREPDDVVWEAADILYFTLVKMIRSGVGWNDVLKELKRRRNA